jgi:arylsulfatase A-like enzyme
LFTADHGEELGEHGYVGHGRHLYENIIHVPLIFRLPGKVSAGKVVHTPVSLVDLAPTILDLALGENWTKENGGPAMFTGRSLAAALEGPGEPPERQIDFVTFAGKKGFMPAWLSWVWIHDGEFPLALGHISGTTKSIWKPAAKSLQIVNLAADPLETKPQVVTNGAQRYRIETARMTQWFQRTNGREGKESLSKQDVEILKSLGYVH